MITPFDIVKHLCEKTPLDYDMKDYGSWVINRGLSNIMDTVVFADMMNRYYHLRKDIQRDFYLHGIPKGKRYGKWHKTVAINIITLIQEKYQCNRQVALSYLSLMNETQQKQLVEAMNRGGNGARNKDNS